MDRPDPVRPDLTYDGAASAEVMEAAWRRPGELVTITFEFDGVRELESAAFHVSNHFTSGVKMFSRASLYFSVDGNAYTSSALTLEPPADRIFEDARRLEVRLYRQVGRYVRLELTAADQWLLISEISFDSAPSAHNVTDLLPLARNMKELRRSVQLTPRHGHARPPADLYGPLAGDEDKIDLAAEHHRVVRLNSEYNTLAQRQHGRPADAMYDYAVPVDTSPPSCSDGPAVGLGGTSRSWDNPNYRQSPHSGAQSSSQPSVCSISELLPSPPPLPPPPLQPTCASFGRRRRLLADGVQGVTGTCVWDSSGAGPPAGRAAVTEISDELIQLRDRIGQGRYGEIRVCEVHQRSSADSPYQAPSRLATARSLRPSPSVGSPTHT
ncbi:discoidin domain-containing receptor 2-like [Pollicipes pollicipes]|uniref:discoidin domain-containing receptor 2-like n=1 Tax=Pollicipes pollicipes TaxID=41117 RepID=UPI001884D872|nr:discoidin domain-containing receptor 2-like [Pollicipes pollicipes]